MAESKEELSLKEESEKAGLKLNISKRNSWHPVPSLYGKKMGKNGNGDRFYFGLQNHCSDCIHKIKRHLLLRRKAITNLDSILESSDITFLTKVHIVKAVASPVVTYGYEGMKKAEH